jgi:hypothetical protein
LVSELVISNPSMLKKLTKLILSLDLYQG